MIWAYRTTISLLCTMIEGRLQKTETLQSLLLAMKIWSLVHHLRGSAQEMLWRSTLYTIALKVSNLFNVLHLRTCSTFHHDRNDNNSSFKVPTLY